jgi:uncharacterized protein YbjT (DUF2867 family)
MILLTGATGRVGSSVSRDLAKANIPFRVVVRNPDKFVLDDPGNIEILTGDLLDEVCVRKAMEGVTKALLLTGNGPGQADIERKFVTIAGQADVRHLVKISSLEASAKTTAALPAMHFESEQFIRSQNLAWTFVRPNFFMQNMLMYSGSIANAGIFAMPLGDARTGMIDTRDVGAVCAKILQEDGHENTTYKLTGADLLTFDEVAQRMSNVLGKPVSYVKQTPQEFRSMLEGIVPSKPQVDAVCELFAEIASGSLELVTPTVKEILNRDPISIEQFTEDFSSAF